MLKSQGVKIKIFLFHRVSPEQDVLWNPMKPERFELIIKLIKRSHSIIVLEDYFRGSIQLTEGKRYAAITFDDGYKDFVKYALPVLAKHKLRASMYIVTGAAETGQPPWTYQLDYLLNNSRTKLLLDREYTRDNARELKDRMKAFSNEDRKSALQTIKEQLNDVVIPIDLMMNWQDVIEVKNWGIEIGSHTVTHPILSSITDRKELEYEMKSSFDVLKEKLGHNPFTLSYPNGSYNEAVKKIAEKTGYQIGLAVQQKTYKSGMQDIYEIPRIELYQQSMIKSAARIFGATDLFK